MENKIIEMSYTNKTGALGAFYASIIISIIFAISLIGGHPWPLVVMYLILAVGFFLVSLDARRLHKIVFTTQKALELVESDKLWPRRAEIFWTDIKKVKSYIIIFDSLRRLYERELNDKGCIILSKTTDGAIIVVEPLVGTENFIIALKIIIEYSKKYNFYVDPKLIDIYNKKTQQIGSNKKAQTPTQQNFYEHASDELCPSCSYEFTASTIFEKGAKTASISCPRCSHIIEKKITKKILEKSKEL